MKNVFSSASACILGFKLTFLAIYLIALQFRVRSIDLEQSRALDIRKTLGSLPVAITSARTRPFGPKFVDKAPSRLDFKARNRRAERVHSKDKDEHNRLQAAILSADDLEGRNVTNVQNLHLHPLSWDKSWWTWEAWLLWTLSCVTPTSLIFVLNGMTQVTNPVDLWDL